MANFASSNSDRPAHTSAVLDGERERLGRAKPGAAEKRGSRGRASRRPGSRVPNPGEDLYDIVLARVEARLPALLAREERRLRKAIELLRRQGPYKLPAARFPRFVALKAYRALSWELRHESPRQMLELSRLALQEAEHLDIEREVGWERSRALAALAWAEVGNALRVNDRFAEAEQAFDMAHHCLHMGSANEAIVARIHSLQSSLLADRGQFERAVEALDTALAIHLRRGERQLAGAALVTKGRHLIESGDYALSLEATRAGLSLLDSTTDPAVFDTGAHNFARALLQGGRAEEAREVLRQHPLRSTTESLLHLRQVWLSGEIAAALGELEAAEQQLTQVRLGLREAGRAYDAAVVAIALASLHLRQNRIEPSRLLCLQASEELFALDLELETRTAILMLAKAQQAGAASVALLDGIVSYLRQRDGLPRSVTA